MRHPGGLLDQALDSTEALRQLPDLRATDQCDGLLLARDQERDHAAEVAHLRRGELVARMGRQTGVEHLLDARLALEVRGDSDRVLAVLLHADGERLQPAQDEPAVERAGDGAERLLEEREALRDRVVVRREEAADDVGVAAEVLRRRVQDDVGSERERLLEVRSREGVVDDDERADGVGSLGRRADVDEVQERVRRRLEPDEPRALLEVIAQAGRDLLRPRGT